ncbi:hypothetical protein MTP99_009472 [Tenebrio molitor]|nr:hypothetical protein MTP99_009472 [Tenebrio molitor]
MQNLEFTENIPKCGHGKRCHNCKRCPYVTKAPFYMVNHVKRHRLPLESSRCERNDLEKYCKDCNFETDLVKKNVRTYIQCLVVKSGTDPSVVPLRQKRQGVLKKHQTAKHPLTGIAVSAIIRNFNTQQMPYSEFKTKWNDNLRRHKKNHL